MDATHGLQAVEVLANLGAAPVEGVGHYLEGDALCTVLSTQEPGHCVPRWTDGLGEFVVCGMADDVRHKCWFPGHNQPHCRYDWRNLLNLIRVTLSYAIGRKWWKGRGCSYIFTVLISISSLSNTLFYIYRVRANGASG